MTTTNAFYQNGQRRATNAVDFDQLARQAGYQSASDMQTRDPQGFQSLQFAHQGGTTQVAESDDLNTRRLALVLASMAMPYNTGGSAFAQPSAFVGPLQTGTSVLPSAGGTGGLFAPGGAMASSHVASALGAGAGAGSTLGLSPAALNTYYAGSQAASALGQAYQTRQQANAASQAAQTQSAHDDAVLRAQQEAYAAWQAQRAPYQQMQLAAMQSLGQTLGQPYRPYTPPW